MESVPATIHDRPLSGFARFSLACAAGLTILLSYLVSSLVVVFLLSLIGIEFLAMLALARFGLARLITGALGSHVELLMLVFRSFWLSKGVDYRIRLEPADAPELFGMVGELCKRTQVKMPREIVLEMSTNAWVRLKGYRRGAGTTLLGIGLDLLAGLSRWEMEGVLAHEISHAKLVQRGYNKWMNRGLGRMWQLARGLYAFLDARRKAGRGVEPANSFFRLSDRLARAATRLVAACSRQDEFDADRGAAALCGAGAIRSSLIKLDALAERSARLPWSERVARLQMGQGFADWLVEELTAPGQASTKGPRPNLFFQYSTHPSLPDRLAALPADTTAPPPSPPAIRLLKEPDKIAESLIAEIQKVAAQQEQKDSKRLRRWSRKGLMRTHLRPVQSLGVVLILFGILAAIGAFFGGFDFRVALFILGVIGVGILCFRLGRYKDRLELSIPGFAILKHTWDHPADVSAEQARQIETELRSKIAKGPVGKAKSFEIASMAYHALARCDYVQAHIASGLALEREPSSIEAATALAVSAGALGRIDQVHQALNFLHRKTGFASPSVLWAAGWALLLCGDWAPAEAFLEKRSRLDPGNANLQLALALCQSKRGKLQSALQLAREVCTPRPANPEQAKFLIDLLLRAGYLREAQRQLRWVEGTAANDPEVMLMMVQISLLSRDFAAAAKWSDALREKKAAPHLLLRLAWLYEVARRPEIAAEAYKQALAGGFYPEALMGLARLEAKAEKFDAARTHLLTALNTERSLGPRAVGPLPLLIDILGHLTALETPEAGCRAWIAKLNHSKPPPALGACSLLVYARDHKEAEQSVCLVFGALQPSAALSPGNITWLPANQELQPEGPVRPGVQTVLQ